MNESRSDSEPTESLQVRLAVELIYSLYTLPEFEIGQDEILKAVCFLNSLIARGDLPSDPDRLCHLIAPLVCTSSSEQTHFYRLFQDQVQACSSPSPAPVDVAGLLNQALRRGAYLRSAAALTIATVAIGSLYFLWPVQQAVQPARISVAKETDEDGIPEQNPIPQEITQSRVLSQDELNLEDLRTSDVGFIRGPVPEQPAGSTWKLLLIASAAVGGTIAFRVISRSQLDAILQRETSNSAPSILATAAVNSDSSLLFRGTDLSQVTRLLRIRSSFPSNRLNVPATIDASVENAGMFSPVYRTRSVSAEYLVLIERRSPQDHCGQLVQGFLKKLREQEVRVTSYWFNGDFRYCQADDDNACVTLQSLHNRHSDYRLIICARGRSLFHPLFGNVTSDLDVIMQWGSHFLLTYDPVTDWGYEEYELIRQGMSVLPLSAEGVQEMATRLQPGELTSGVPGTFAPHLPQLIDDNSEYWLASTEPEIASKTTLLHELEGYLGRDGMTLLAACAIYPEVHWNLTLFIGELLVPDYCSLQNVISLSRLPWFRVGYMPDWLRRSLLNEVTTAQSERIRFAIDQILVTAAKTNEPNNSRLNIAWDNRKLLEQLGSRIAAGMKRGTTDKALQYDAVFFRFAESTRPNSVAYRLSQQVTKLLTAETPQAGSPSRLRRLARSPAFLFILIAIALASVLLQPALRKIGLLDQVTSTAEPGYGPELSEVVSLALADLRNNLTSECLSKLMPRDLLRRLETNGVKETYLQYVEREQSLGMLLADDLAAINDFLSSGGQPIMNDQQNVATFVLERPVTPDRSAIPEGRAAGTQGDLSRPNTETYTVTCKFELLDGSWRFPDSTERLGDMQRALVREAGIDVDATE